jgi:prepilin-type N-terminal cleavage/methylation domain-containing protein
MMKKINKVEKGFTLIELLIVVAIIAILAAIAIPNFLQAQVRSKVSRTLADYASLATAIEAYQVDNNSYPDDGIPQPLSTPIAYITSFPSSPWNEYWYPWARNDDPLPFCYVNNTYLYASDMAWGPSYAKYQNNPGLGNIGGDYISYVGRYEGMNLTNFDPQTIQWELKSCGPAGIDDVDAELNPSHYPPSDSGIIACLYDPTNGTVSTGNLIWFNDGTGSGRGM